MILFVPAGVTESRAQTATILARVAGANEFLSIMIGSDVQVSSRHSAGWLACWLAGWVGSLNVHRQTSDTLSHGQYGFGAPSNVGQNGKEETGERVEPTNVQLIKKECAELWPDYGARFG